MSLKLHPKLEPGVLVAVRAGLTSLGSLPLGWSRSIGRGCGRGAAAAGVHVPFFGVPEGFELRFSTACGLDVAEPKHAARALNAGIEDLLRPVLDQYLWAYKRYKRPPLGISDPYRE